MSDHNENSSPRTFLMVLGALVAFTIIIMYTAGSMTEELEAKKSSSISETKAKAAVADRIKPIAMVAIAKVKEAPAAAKSGAEIVAASCVACHGTGALSAPKIGDGADWEARLTAEGGIEGLTQSGIVGKGAMPPKGGAAVSDADIKAAVIDMLKESGVDVEGSAVVVAKPTSEAASPMKAVSNMMNSMTSAATEMATAATEVIATSDVDLEKGKSTYGSACFGCHASGIAGAPKLGDKAAWASRVEQGLDGLVKTAINGKGGMPPKGGRLDLSDDDIKAAVAYMIEEIK